MSILQQLKREGSIALWHDYRAGHALDFSGNGNDGTVVNAGWFDSNGFHTSYLGDEAIQVAHSASINLDTFTVIGFLKTKRIVKGSSDLPQLARKNDGVGLSWSIRLDDAGTNISIDAAASATWSSVSRPFDGVQCVGCNLESGNANTACYIDGLVEDVTLSSVPTINLNASDLYIANRSLLDRGLGSPLASFLMFNKLLSATEHRDVYLELLK